MLDQENEAPKFETPASSSSTSTYPKHNCFFLNEKTCENLLDYLLNYSYMNVKLWHLTFRMLTCLLSNASLGLATSFVNNKSLYKIIYKFVSSNEELVGDECCHTLLELLSKLNKLTVTHGFEKVFKMNMFQILCDCINDNGCIKDFKGPLDAQVRFKDKYSAYIIFHINYTVY